MRIAGPKIMRQPGLTSAVLLIFAGAVLSGCAQEFETASDVYVPASVEERFPITVAERPVSLALHPRSAGLHADQVSAVKGFAQDARANATSGVTISYPKSSKSARNTAQQATRILAAQGVPRSMIHTRAESGANKGVTLSFVRKVAVTKECGDWSQNMRGNMYNEPYPNQGCALQNNIAAMVANPEDFERPRTMTPAPAAARSAATEAYNSGKWTTPGSSEGFSE